MHGNHALEGHSSDVYAAFSVSPFEVLNAVLALPHRLTEEDSYKGYRLPKGSIIVPNAWYVFYYGLTTPLVTGNNIGQCFTTRTYILIHLHSNQTAF